MKYKKLWYGAGLVAVIGAGYGAIFLLQSFGGPVGEPFAADGIVAESGVSSTISGMDDRANSADGLPVDAADRGRTVKSASGDFSFNMPSSWYLERNESSGMVVYPDYDPRPGVSPDCKIEVSRLGKIGGGGLNGFVAEEMRTDRSLDAAEIARKMFAVSGKPAIEWRGSLNGATTTLVYVAANESVLEIAPSMLGPGEMADNDDCNLALREFLSRLKL